MKIGYARVSTQDQDLSLQLDALEEVGCRQIYREKMSGSAKERPQLRQMLAQLREGDTVVIWKLDRLARSIKDMVSLVNEIQEKGAELHSLNDHIDTTTPHGKFTFHIFAALAEFERDIIRERTKAGLAAARARGRKGGRPKGLSKKAQHTAIITEQLYQEGALTVKEICEQLSISKGTFYNYLHHREVEVGASRQKKKVMQVGLWLRVEGNNKYVRGKKKARQDIERYVLQQYDMEKPRKDDWDYVLHIPYQTDEELDEIVYDIIREAAGWADDRNCFIETDAIAMDSSDKSW
jgi:DNA invertase Pin-like site-specific DNA recombinase